MCGSSSRPGQAWWELLGAAASRGCFGSQPCTQPYVSHSDTAHVLSLALQMLTAAMGHSSDSSNIHQGPAWCRWAHRVHKERTNSLIISSPTPVSSSRLLYWELRHRGKPFPVFLMPVKLVQHYLQKFFYVEKWLHKNVMEGFDDYFLSVITMTNLQICQVERYLFVFRWQPCKPSLEFKKQAGASLALVSPAAETPHSDHNQHFWWQRTSQNTPEPSYWAQLNLQS